MSRSKQQASSYEPGECEDVDTSRSLGPSNSDAIRRLNESGGGSEAPDGIDIGGVASADAFAKVGAAALGALIPGPGTMASLKISGRFPFYSTGAFTAFLEPMLALGAARTSDGACEVTLALQLGVRAEAGTKGMPWWASFSAALKAYVKGAVKIVGDSPREIFDQLLLTLSNVIDSAAAAADVPKDEREAIVAAIAGDAGATIQGLDKDDGVTASISAGAEASGKLPWGETTLGAEATYSRKLGDANDDGKLDVEDSTSLTLSSQLNLATLGLTVPANVTLVWKDGALDEWFLGMGVTRKLPLGDFTKEALGGAAWAAGFANGVANLVASAGAKAKLDVSETAQLVRAISPVEEAMTYSATAGMLKSAAGQPWFQEKSGQEVSFALDGQAGWSAEKGANLRVALSTAETWTLGEEGVTPLFIEARTGDTLVSFEDAAQGGQRGGT